MPYDSAAIAVAAVILPKGSEHFQDHIQKQQCSNKRKSLRQSASANDQMMDSVNALGKAGTGILPMEMPGRGMFLTEPSLESLSHWASSHLSPSPTSSLLIQNARLCLFFPISVTSLTANQVLTTITHTSSTTKATLLSTAPDYRLIKRCCERSNLTGIYFDVSGHI